MRLPALTVIGLAGTIVIAGTHALLSLGADVWHRVIDEDTGPLGPRA